MCSSAAHKLAAATAARRTAETDLLAAILRLDLGTVPRALDLAGVDRAAILASRGRQPRSRRLSSRTRIA